MGQDKQPLACTVSPASFHKTGEGSLFYKTMNEGFFSINALVLIKCKYRSVKSPWHTSPSSRCLM